MNDLNWRKGYLRLGPGVSLKHLENLFLYNCLTDELYEVSENAGPFLMSCDGTATGESLAPDEPFVAYCVEEGLIEVLPGPDPLRMTVAKAPNPSLRYLELQLLHRCNLSCRHCYLGARKPVEMSLSDAVKIVDEFAVFGGLRLLISGGEPLLYPRLKDFLDQTAAMNLHRVLFTNGTLITEENVQWLRVEEVQFSLDGMHQGHDLLRGKGSFVRTVRGMGLIREAGIPISIATMIHRGNIHEFETLRRFIEDFEAVEWGIDVMSLAGSLTRNQDLMVSLEEAVPLMTHGFGGGVHGSSEGFACGRHLLSVLPTGKAVKCGFYEGEPLGDARDGLVACWLKLKHIPIEALECRTCPVVVECGGGCRFRAVYPGGPDPVMCAIFGVTLANVSNSRTKRV